MTSRKYNRALTSLGTIMDKEITEVFADLYRAALHEYSDQQVVEAMGIAATTCRFFPRPVELIEIIQSNDDHRKISSAIIGNLDFELAEGGEIQARAWIDRQPLAIQGRLLVRLRTAVKGLDSARVNAMIAEIGKDSIGGHE